jgi:hypothetical protein
MKCHAWLSFWDVLFFLLLASSLCMLVGRQIVVATHRPPICSTPALLRVLAFLVDILNIHRGFQTSKGFYCWWSIRQRLLWIRLANLAALWNIYPLLRIKCRVWWLELCILKNATPSLLVSLSPSVRCCDVRFLAASLFFPFTSLLWVNILSCLRYLPGPCWWNTLGF